MFFDVPFPPEPRIENEAISLIERGHEVHLFCLTFDPKSKLREEYKGIQIHRYLASKFTYRLSALAYTLPLYHLILAKKIKHFMALVEPEVIHIHDMQIARSLFWVNKKYKKRIVLDLHVNRPEIMKSYAHVMNAPGKFLIFPSWWKKHEFKQIKEADDVIVVTNEAKDYYERKLPKTKGKYIVLPNTIRKSFFEDYKTNPNIIEKYKNNFVLLYLGHTGTRRGTLEMIESITYLKNEIQDLKLVIVGKSNEDDQLLDKIKKHKLENHIDLLGWQDFSLFQSFIKASHIGMSPLHRNIHHDTTYANKIFQYMSLGLPVIVSESTAQKAVIQELNSGLIHQDKSPNDIAKKVLQLYNSPTLRDEMSKNAIEGIKNHYNWEITARKLFEIYE